MAAPNTHIDELLNLYLDRELSRADEEQLYSRLAEDAQLRSRLKHMQMLRSETRNYLAGLTPPAALTGSVFTGLGFSSSTASAAGEAAREAAKSAAAGALVSGASTTTTATSAGSTAVSATSGILGTVKSLWMPISAAIITATVTTIVILSMMDSGAPVQTPNTTESVTAPLEQPSTATQTSPAEVVPPKEVTPPEEPVRPAETVSPAVAAPPTEAVSPVQAVPPAQSVSETNERSAESSLASAGLAASTSLTLQNEESESASHGTTEEAVATPDPQAGTASESISGISAEDVVTRETETRPVVEPAPEPVVKTDPTVPTSKPAEAIPAPVQPLLLPYDVQVPYAPFDQSQRTPVVLLPGDTRETSIGDRMVLQLDNSSQRGIAILLRGYAASSFPGVAVGTRSKYDLERMFENASVGFYYRMTGSEIIGVEIGQDAFTQKYSGFIRGEERNVEQNLLTPWVTMNYRYTFDGLFGQVLLRPYLSAGTGVTQQAWSLSRGSGGFILAPNDTFEMMFGLEGMLMAYPFDGQWFSTQKLGFSYALVVNF